MYKPQLQSCLLIVAAITVAGQVIAQQRPRGPDDATASRPAAVSELPKATGKTRVVAISVQDSRPLSAAADALQRQFGIPISYEDPAWASSDDLMELGKFPDPRNQKLKNPDRLAPVLGTLDFQFDVDTGTGKSTRSVEALLQEVFASHFSHNNAGEFKVIPVGKAEGFSIVPNRIKNVSRSLLAVDPVLNVRISLDEKDREGNDTLDEITKAISSASGKPIVIMVAPTFRRSVTFGAKDEVARDVLARFLHKMMPTKASWKLFYDANDHYFGLSIQQVSIEVISLQGTKELQPVVWQDWKQE